MSKNIRTSVIILAAGNSSRFNNELPKQYLKINNREIIDFSIQTFKSVEEINEIILVVSKKYITSIQNKYPDCVVVLGGNTRKESSYNGLLACNKQTTKVLIHDAARMFVDIKQIKTCINNLDSFDAITLGTQCVDTIAESINNKIQIINDRDKQFCVQTPQGFIYKKIMAAHEQFKENATDDIQIMLKAGYECKLIEGSQKNFKITHERDLILANELVKKSTYEVYSCKKNKFLFIIQYDSFLRNLIPVIEYLIKRKYKCDVILYHSLFKKKWFTEAMKDKISYLENLQKGNFRTIRYKIRNNSYDVVIMGTIGSRLIKRVYDYKNKLNKNNLKIASGYIGLLLENNVDSFLKGVRRRSITNLIWTPGLYDKNKILDTGFINELNTNVIDTGLPNFDKLFELKSQIKPQNKKNVVFLEQPTFPESKSERTLLVKKLVDYAILNKDINVIIKPRFMKKVGHAHRPKFLLQDIIKVIPNIPSNIEFNYDDIYNLYQNCGKVLTISSTAGIESMLAGIPTYFITDFCNNENKYGSSYFKAFNACINFENLYKNKLPDIDYKAVKKHIKFDGNNTKKLADELIMLSNKSYEKE